MSLPALFEERPWVRNNRLSGDRLATMLPSTAFEDDLIVNVDGSFGLGWHCAFPYLFTLGSDRSGQLFNQLKKMFNVLSGDFDVQVIFPRVSEQSSWKSASPRRVRLRVFWRTTAKNRKMTCAGVFSATNFAGWRGISF